ncbi:MAG TPA: hypothetical protein VL308_21780 [Gemmatimonadaceae bacterium]|jgi:hypothetical protein|nr:hypothetical protein [Gemmatimonadaceae bacterium]
MKEDELNERTREALRGYRVPPAPPLDAMWERIEERHFGAPVVALADHGRSRPQRRWAFGSPSWSVLVAGIAAALILGIAVGRMSHGIAPVIADNGREGQYDYWTANAAPYREATTEYLGQTVALLTALPAATRDGQPDARFVTQASDLLTTTRLLLDSPAAESDPRLKSLLEDLELVLAQLSRLPSEHGGPELNLITQALEQRDVVPRVRAAAASISSDD